MAEDELHLACAAFPAGPGVRALQDAQLDARGFDFKPGVKRQDRRADCIDTNIACGCGGGDDARPREEDVERVLAEGREEAEGQEEVGETAGVGGG